MSDDVPIWAHCLSVYPHAPVAGRRESAWKEMRSFFASEFAGDYLRDEDEDERTEFDISFRWSWRNGFGL